MRLLRCGVVGVGHLGRYHALKYFNIGDCQLVALCDLNVHRPQALLEELKASPPAAAPSSVKITDDFRNLLGLVDAVTIATHTSSHFEIAQFFLENGVHVLIEKPMTETSQQALQLCQLAKGHNLRLQIGHVERFNSAFQAARQRLQRPLFIECHRLAPFKPRSIDVDVVLDLMIHDLDVVLSLVDSEIKHISGVGAAVLTSKTDIANARIEFKSGAIANLTASRVSQTPTRKIRVFQSNQYLSIDFGTGQVSLLTRENIPANALSDERFGNRLKKEEWSLSTGDALLAETRSFVESIQQEKDCVVSGEQGMAALKLAEAISGDIDRRSQTLCNSSTAVNNCSLTESY